MATPRGSTRQTRTERLGDDAAVAARTHGLDRVVLTGPLDDASARSTADFLNASGVSLVPVDTSAEDPFIDVNHLLPDADMSDADAVIALGPPSATAVAIALLCDLPLTMAGFIDGRRFAAIDTALASGSAMHRSVLDVEIDGVRRLSLTDLDIAGPEHMVARLSDPAGERVVESARFGIGSERPHSGRLFVEHGDELIPGVQVVELDGAPPVTRAAINGREQRFRRLTVEVHDKPLRQLVLR